MEKPLRFVVLAAATALCLGLSAAPAHAGIESCGNIDVKASATCKAEVGTTCKASCTPIQFHAACTAQVDGTCSTKCSKPPEVSCQGTCEGDCNTECTTTGATFACEGSCTTSCEGTCAGKCSTTGDAGAGDAGHGDQASCEASCKATCGTECQGSCTGTAPSADCTTKCKASCQGSCTADVNMACQTDCRGTAYTSCESDFQGQCEIECDDPDGALFCDGEYVDKGGNGQKCIDALNAYLKSHVQASASGSCTGNVCQGQAKANCHCSTPAMGRGSSGEGLFVGALAALAALSRRRPRR